jgi:hypothetical protein
MASDSDDVFMSACEEVPLPMSSQGFGRGEHSLVQGS